ncbi:MAG: Mth938-like domain-containing protein [Deltaproteobacteria bacterium]|nr:Mth938-like domain-containing protein [Deltaproteobacteria bacterium]
MEIQSYRFGHIVIDGKAYSNDVKLVGETVLSDWFRSKGHLVKLEDVKDLLDTDADVCIFGTGAYGAMRVSEAVRSAFENRGVKVIVEKTKPACRTYNTLSKEGKKVVAGFHLTC